MRKSYRLLISGGLLFITSFYFTGFVHAQTYCFPEGNVILYSNYDGGYLNIDVDEDIPGLKIGITTYEKCEVTISGQYAGNITEVIYAGYNGNNDPCNPTPPATSINGVPAAITSILLSPPVTWTNSNGYYYVICNYSCDSSTGQGGCNTPDQIVHYYLTQFGGSLYYHYTQYGCWQGTHHVSDGGNCCIGAAILDPQYAINAAFSVTNDTLCAKDSVLFFNSSYNTFPGATTYTWNFGDGTPATIIENPSHIYGAQGNYEVTLVASNSAGTASDTAEMNLTLINCFTGDGNISALAGLQIIPNPVEDELCIYLKGKKPYEAHLRLYGPLGKLFFTGSIPATERELCFERTIEKIPPGIYLAVITMNDERRSIKVVFE